MRAPSFFLMSTNSTSIVWTMWSLVICPSFLALLMMLVAHTRGIQYLDMVLLASIFSKTCLSLSNIMPGEDAQMHYVKTQSWVKKKKPLPISHIINNTIIYKCELMLIKWYQCSPYDGRIQNSKELSSKVKGSLWWIIFWEGLSIHCVQTFTLDS